MVNLGVRVFWVRGMVGVVGGMFFGGEVMVRVRSRGMLLMEGMGVVVGVVVVGGVGICMEVVVF